MTATDYDREKAMPDVIDNQNAHMSDVLNLNLPMIHSLDIASGYFQVSGYRVVRDALEKAVADPSFLFRLMIGKDTIRTDIHTTFEEYSEHQATLEADLDNADLSQTGMSDVAGLITLLNRDNVQIRLGRSRFNHAKCYILGDKGVIVGSSNFTKSGLCTNDELNAGVYVTGTWRKVKDWYNMMWEDATEAKADLIHVLEQSKFGVPATPHEIYLKILFEKYRRILDTMEESDTATAKTLAKFQQHAVRIILQTIDEYGGAMLADSTGLGKTHIGMAVMRKMSAEGRKILLVAPAQIRDTVWKKKLREAQIYAERIGTEELGREDFNVFKYKKYDFVIIDESQNFRSKSAGRRQNLMKIMSLGKKKQVLLMSATPVNNSLMDLYYQVSIITGDRDDLFADIGIPDLYVYMKKASKRKLNDGLERIQLLLDAIMVRRTRTYIKEAYPDEKIDDKPITFPARDYKPIRYKMTDLFGDIYSDLNDTVKSLKMAPYGIEKYNTRLTDEERHKHTILASLQVVLLLKRFESSMVAVMKSIENKITLFQYFEKVLNQNRIISPKEFNKIILKRSARDVYDGTDDEKRDEFFMKQIRDLPLRDAAGYDIKLMKKEVRSDLILLRGYLDSLRSLPNTDKKAKAVVDMIRRDRALDIESRKVLIFTEYAETAKYIRRFLKDEFPGRKIALITGDVNKNKRAEIIREFSPRANTEEGDDIPDTETDMLVSTEVLSEGQNLQDCNYVINYDLPWNPMRIVQRIGRVDRLNSTHDTVHSRECFPEEDLDRLLKLTSNLTGKIEDVNDTVGMESDLLGQEATVRNFKTSDVGRIEGLAGGDAADIIDEMEHESDMTPKRTPINEINAYIRKAGISKMKAFPMGRRSGKVGEGQSIVLAYLQEKPRRRLHSVVYDCVSAKAEDIDNMEAIKLIWCTEDEKTYLSMDADGNAESFAQLLRADTAARSTIEQKGSTDSKIAQEIRSRPNKAEKIIEKIPEILVNEVDRGGLTEEAAQAVDHILKSADLRQWVDDLEDLEDDYNATHDIKSLILQLKKIGDNIGAGDDKADGSDEAPGPLVLVGAMFITG